MRKRNLPRKLGQETLTFQTLIDNLPDGIFLKDRKCRFVFANQIIADLIGVADPAVLVGKTDHDFYPKEVADTLLADERVVIEKRRRLVNKEEIKSLPSGVRHILTTKVPLIDAKDDVTGLLGITRDVTERSEVEERLRRGEQRYRNLLEQAADGIFLLDQDGNFLMTNAAICEMLGYARDELPRLNILDTYPEELREIGRARLETIKSLDALRFEREMKRKDGVLFPAEISWKRLEDGTIHGIARDVSERKRLAQSLDAQRELLQIVIDSLPDLVFVKDRQSRFVLVNRSLAQFAGAQDPKELIGKSDSDFSPVELADRYVQDDRKVMETAKSIVNSEEASTFASGASRWILTTKVPLMSKDETVTGLVGISRDITERKLAEQQLESLARFPDENPNPIVRISPEGAVIYANKASEAMTSSWEGRKIPQRYLPGISLAWEIKERREIELSEASRTYAVTIVPFASAGYINLYGRDVTEEKALAERLNQAQKIEALGQLTGGVAHDFNNVLQVITGYCEVLTLRLPEENQKYVAEIAKAAKRAASLTSQLLAFSRRQILRPRVVNTKEMIQSMHTMLERALGEDVELRTFIDPQTGNFVADPGKIEQVLLNLAVNARDAMPSGGKLTIETSNRSFDEAYVRDHPGSKAGQYVRIAVSDTGVGMHQETMSHIYEPFFTTKREGKGTGLGLSTVYGIVKQSEGYINCYSEIGKGTSFTVYLPLTLEEADTPLVTEVAATAPRGTETVLLVDDDSAVRSVARIALEGAGYSVIEASGAEEALSAVSERNASVALLITDVVMPRMPGVELARKLGEISSKVRVLYTSGYTANVISHHGILEAGLDYLEKPFSSLELLRKVREILDRPP